MLGFRLSTQHSALVTLLLLAPPAFAHRLNVTVTPLADPPRLRVQAAYDGGEPADGATAAVRDDAGERGRVTLDAGGVGELPDPGGAWSLTVDDGAGHRATVRFDRPSGDPRPRRWLMVLAGLLLIGGWAGWRRMRSAK